MAMDHPIPEFPTDIDRDAFGHYIAGLTDGEGHFNLTCHTEKGYGRVKPRAAFRLKLRADDLEILETIRSYFGCGYICKYQPKYLNNNLVCTYRVNDSRDLFNKICRHFERYPLRAKKKRDFLIWRRAVELCYKIAKRRRRMGSGGRGTMSKWSKTEYDQYVLLSNELQSIRKFDSKMVGDLPEIRDVGRYREGFLFDQ